MYLINGCVKVRELEFAPDPGVFRAFECNASTSFNRQAWRAQIDMFVVKIAPVNTSIIKKALCVVLNQKKKNGESALESAFSVDTSP